MDKVHRDGTYTVTALWNVDRATGQDTVDMGHLGYVYRMHGGLLMDRVGRDRNRMTKLIPHPALKYVTPDTVAECWDGIGDDLYEALWHCVAKYDNAYRENIEDIGPHDVIGINAVTDFWDGFTPEQQIKLNAVAADQQHAYEELK